MKWYTSISTLTWLTLDHRPGVSDLLDISLPNTVVHQPFGIIVGNDAHIIFQSFLLNWSLTENRDRRLG